MNERMNVEPAVGGDARLWRQPAPISVDEASWALERPGLDRPQWPQAVRTPSVDACVETLVSAYLAANLDGRRTSLKEFMDDLERRILHSCLTLTQGHQRNAAGILGLKYTALFEKMRKHCINGRQIKLSRRLRPVPADR